MDLCKLFLQKILLYSMDSTNLDQGWLRSGICIFATHFVVIRRIGAVLTYFLQLVWCEVFLQKVLESPDFSRQYLLPKFGRKSIEHEEVRWNSSANLKLGGIEWLDLWFKGSPLYFAMANHFQAQLIANHRILSAQKPELLAVMQAHPLFTPISPNRGALATYRECCAALLWLDSGGVSLAAVGQLPASARMTLCFVLGFPTTGTSSDSQAQRAVHRCASGRVGSEVGGGTGAAEGTMPVTTEAGSGVSQAALAERPPPTAPSLRLGDTSAHRGTSRRVQAAWVLHSSRGKLSAGGE